MTDPVRPLIPYRTIQISGNLSVVRDALLYELLLPHLMDFSVVDFHGHRWHVMAHEITSATGEYEFTLSAGAPPTDPSERQ